MEGPAQLAEVDRRPDRVQELLPRDLAGEQDDRRDEPEPVRRRTHRVTPRRWSARAGSAAASARRTRRPTAQFVMPGHVKGQTMPGFLGGSDLAVPVTSSNKALAADWIKDFTGTSSEKAPPGEGQHPEHDQPARHERQRARRRTELVRPDREALGRRRERQHPPQHAGADPHRQAVGQAGGVVGQRQHRIGAEPAVTGAREQSNGARRRDLASGGLGGIAVSGPERGRGAVPYGLIAPVVVVIAVILGYPLYWLVKLSFERYGLFELIRAQGRLRRARELPLGPQRPRLLAHAPPHGRLHGGQRRSDDGDRHAARAAARARQHRRAASCSARGSCSSGRCRSSSPCRSGSG